MISSGAKSKREYQEFAKQRTPNRPVLQNVIRAFLVGGSICLIGQVIETFYVKVFGFTQTTASNPTISTLVLISVILTGFGVYDRLGQWAGAGSAVPVTGFANSMAAAALEYKSEGYVLGVAGNMFKLAGPIIVYGVLAAFFVSLIRTLFGMF